MYSLVLTLHSVVRWAIVIVGVVAVVRAWMGWRGNKPWAQLDDRLGLGFTSVMDLNLLLGLLLYFVLSPITTGALQGLRRGHGQWQRALLRRGAHLDHDHRRDCGPHRPRTLEEG